MSRDYLRRERTSHGQDTTDKDYLVVVQKRNSRETVILPASSVKPGDVIVQAALPQ